MHHQHRHLGPDVDHRGGGRQEGRRDRRDGARDIKKSGKLIVGVNVPTPNEFRTRQRKIVGFDVDLMNARDHPRLTADYREADFAKIIPPPSQGGTFNVGMSSFTDTKERQAVGRLRHPTSAGPHGPGRRVSSITPDNACGRRWQLAQTTTTQEVDELPGRSKACVDAGKPPIDILQKFDGQDAATNAVVLGQADAMSADSPVTLYAIKQSSNKLERAGQTFDSAPYGWPVRRARRWRQSLQKALEHLISTGDYKTIATNWGVEAGMIDKPVINGATS